MHGEQGDVDDFVGGEVIREEMPEREAGDWEEEEGGWGGGF